MTMTTNHSERNTMTTLPVAPGLTSLFEDGWEELGEESGIGHRSLQRERGSSSAASVVPSSSQEPLSVVAHDIDIGCSNGLTQCPRVQKVRTEHRCRVRRAAGQFLGAAIQASGMSQRAWARLLGIDEARVRKMVTGEVGVDLGACIEGGRVGLEVLRQALAVAEAKVR